MEKISEGKILSRFHLTKIKLKFPFVSKVIFITCLAALGVLASWLFLPNFIGNDWIYVFRVGAESVLAGINPYSVNQFMLPPWALILFIPLSWLPDTLVSAILRIGSLIIFAMVAIRLKAKPIGLVALLLSPQVFHTLINGNIDAFAVLGFILPPQIGLFFLALKPQIGITLAIYWAYMAYRKKELVRTFAPFLIVLGLSVLIFGFWPSKLLTVQSVYNASLWPFSIPFGLVLLEVSLRKQQERISQGISPLLSPHVMFHSWVAPLIALAPDTIELVLAVVCSWFLVGLSAGLGFLS
jgi:hypothetical protein